MSSHPMSEKAASYLAKLCLDIPGRRVGSDGNRQATAFVAGAVSAFGFDTQSLAFDCIDWAQAGADLAVGGTPFQALVSPYTLGCRVRAPLAVVSTVEEVEAAPPSDRIVLLRGEIAKEQLMPKNFTFYNPDEHKRIVRALETARPLAIVAATSRDPSMAGAVYPFPLIEDGDFDIPSVYMTEEEGAALAPCAGREAVLDIRARRSPSTGYNVVARKGTHPGRRAVLFAHVDAKEGTPGALDNAAGVTILLLLAELLADYAGRLGVELVAMNGEDYYAAPGEQQWLGHNAGRLQDIALGINIDGAGHRGGRPAYSLYGCPTELSTLVHRVFAAYPDLVEGQPWYQSDHGLFLANGIPALAVTSEQFTDLWSEVAHTPLDRPEIVDPAQLVRTALALRDLLLHLDRHGG